MTIVPCCSRWAPPIGRHWPALVAEDLRRVPEPLRAWLRLPPPASPEAVASCLAHALLPPVAPDPPPPWLRPDQRLSFGRALAAARRHGGALLADGVGSGKTWIGLAVAAALEPGSDLHVIAPAVVRGQWEAVARRAGVTIRFHSHETLSRGRAPPGRPGPVIVDESHRFRNPGTRRYETLCRWCVGRRGILLTATPAVNRLEDVEHQLLLLVRHDALTPEFRGLVLTGEDRSAGIPGRAGRDIQPVEPTGSPAGEILEGIHRLRLSGDAGIAALIRVSLYEAMASSPAALMAALARYRALLEHGGDAAASGVRVSRRQIRQLVGADLDQLVLWPMVAEAGPEPELALTDLPEVIRLMARTESWQRAGDAKLQALRSLLADARPTLVFTSSLATVRHLRSGLGSSGIAWCTGSGAGLDHTQLDREAVLDWFRRPAGPAPASLVATDVAAEGVDLPRVERVVHYDLPWTAVRLEQRAGRALRLESGRPMVEVVRFRPSAHLERQLDKLTVINTKDALVDRLGLRNVPEAPWRRSARVAARWAGIPRREGLACVRGREQAMVVAARIHSTGGGVTHLVRARLAGRWTCDEAVILPWLEEAAAAPGVESNPRRWRSALTTIAAMLRPELGGIAGRFLAEVQMEPGSRAIIRRLRALACKAIQARRREVLPMIDRGIRFLGGGHTAGEQRMIAGWASLPDRRLLHALAELPGQSRAQTEGVELIGVLLVEPAPAGR